MTNPYSILPIDVISDPNFYSPTASGTLDLTDGNAGTFWFQLTITDNLGTRPFTPAVSSTITLTFQRANAFSMPFYPTVSQAPTETIQTVIVQGIKSIYNPSLFNINLSAQNVQQIRSGTLNVTLVNNGVTTTWGQNWLVNKTSNKPGC